MIPFIRKRYNAAFTEEKYRMFINDMNNYFHYDIEFRISETPVFVDKELKQQLIDAGDEIVKVILHKDFKKVTEEAVPPQCLVPNENDHPHFLAIDFAICDDGKGG